MKILKMLFSSFLTFVINNFESENVDLTLFDVVNSKVYIYNVVSTLIWVTLRRNVISI